MKNWQGLVLLLCATHACGKPKVVTSPPLIGNDITNALNTTDALLKELDALRKDEFDFFQYFTVHIGAMFNSIELHLGNLGVAQSEVQRLELLINEAMLEILTITQKQVTNKDDLTFLDISIMANLVNNLPLLPEDKDTLESLLEQTNNDLNSAWRVIIALLDSVNEIILGLIDGMVGESAQVIYDVLDMIQTGLQEQYQMILVNQQKTTNVGNSLVAELEEVIVNNQIPFFKRHQ